MMRRQFSRRQVLAAAAGCGARPLFAGAANWPAFRGAGGSGVAADATPAAWNCDAAAGAISRVRWKTPLPGLGHSSPIVWGNRVFVATAISASGKAPLRLGLFGDPTAAADDEEQRWVVVCLDARSGAVLWKQTARTAKPRAQRHEKATHANTTVATDGRRLVAFFGSEGLYCYDLDGKLLWQRDLGVINVSKYGIGWGFASSPALHGDRVFVQCDSPDDPYLAALSLKDGRDLWKTPRKDVCERSWGTPYVHAEGGRVQVVANGWPYIASYDADSGREIWRLRGGGDNPIPTPFGAEGLIFVANAHGGQAPLYAIRPSAEGDISLPDGASANRHVAWSTPQNGAYISTPVVYREQVYSLTNNGVIKCYEARTGRKLYDERLEAGIAVSASPVAADGKVYCTAEEGDVFVVRAGAKLEILARNRMGEPCMATPAIAGGVLYFRTTAALIAIG
jgi:outer membrane protein assembly factor BamB